LFVRDDKHLFYVFFRSKGKLLFTQTSTERHCFVTYNEHPAVIAKLKSKPKLAKLVLSFVKHMILQDLVVNFKRKDADSNFQAWIAQQVQSINALTSEIPLINAIVDIVWDRWYKFTDDKDRIVPAT
jgi:hypothetical protein